MTRRRPDPTTWQHRLRVTIRPFKRADQLLPALYVASDLAHIEASALNAMHLARDLEQPGTDSRMRSMRRLDAAWLTWLSRRLHVAQDQGPLHPELLRRWAAIIAWATNRYGSRAVDQACCTYPDARYQPPSIRIAA